MQAILEEVAESLITGTLEARDDAHLSALGVHLDRIGRPQLMAALAQMAEWAEEIGRESARRLTRSGDAWIPVMVALMAFERAPQRIARSG